MLMKCVWDNVELDIERENVELDIEIKVTWDYESRLSCQVTRYVIQAKAM